MQYVLNALSCDLDLENLYEYGQKYKTTSHTIFDLNTINMILSMGTGVHF